MAKKSYLGKLANGFVRSAVNQVGRDGGRVISNQIYGDAHSTPIRGTGTQQTPPPLQSAQIGNIGNVGNAEVVPTLNKEMIGWMVAILCTCGLASIIAFFKGLHYYKKDSVTYRQYVVEKVPIIDRRYNSGVRGYTTQSGYKYFEVPNNEANPNDVKRQKSLARTLMIISGVVLFIFLCAAMNVKLPTFQPVMFITIPLLALYAYVMWKPVPALDFVSGSNVKRRIVATVIFLIIYCSLFALKVHYFPNTPATQTEQVADPAQ